MFGTNSFKTLLAAGALVLAAGAASAVTVNFERITSNSASDSAGQLSLEVTDDGTRALFAFSVGSNSPAPDASIAEIYFSDTGILFTPPPALVTQTGVSFVAGSANPGNLPGANNASPDFQVTASLLADANPGNANAIQFGDLLVLGLNYSVGSSFSGLLAALDSGAFRVGLHVRSLLAPVCEETFRCEESASDSFVSTPPAAVPVPAAGFLMIGALGGLAALRRRRRAV